MEVWKKIASTKGMYEVSNEGRVRSRVSGQPRLLKTSLTKTGRINVAVGKGKDRRTEYVHKLVLEAFISPRPKGLEANHKNGTPSDNRVSNLEWVTRSENMVHAYRNGLNTPRRGSLCGSAKLTWKDVRKIRGLKGKKTQLEIAKMFGITKGNVQFILHGKTWKIYS